MVTKKPYLKPTIELIIIDFNKSIAQSIGVGVIEQVWGDTNYD